MSENNGIKARTVTCPACGGSIDLPVGRNKAACTFCGNEVVIDEPGWLGELDKFDLKLQNAQTALENKQWKWAGDLFEECSRINAADPRPWKGIIEARTRCFTAGLDETTDPAFSCYLLRSGLGMNDPFVDSYKEFLVRVSDNDAANAAGNAKENIKYFERMIEGYNGSIADIGENINTIKNTPSTETAEKKYGGAKARLVVDSILLFAAPAAVVGFIVLAVVLLVSTIQGDAHVVGIIASVVAALVFAGITKYVWKHYRQSINSFKRRRVSKLEEDHLNATRAQHNEELVNRKNDTINEYRGNIEDLKAAIDVMNNYLAIDRDKRISVFTKLHYDTAGISNSIVIDDAIVRISEAEKEFKCYPGYRPVTSIKKTI